MTDDLKMSDNPMDTAMDVLSKAFNPTGRRRREAMRILKSVLNLAISRGFKEQENFMAFFKQDIKIQDPKVLQKILFNLFEYVSPDEFAQLSKKII